MPYGWSIALVLIGAAVVAASLGDPTLSAVGVLISIAGVLIAIIAMIFGPDQGTGPGRKRPMA